MLTTNGVEMWLCADAKRTIVAAHVERGHGFGPSAIALPPSPLHHDEPASGVGVGRAE